MDNSTITYKNLKISPLTKKRLDSLKGRLTYDKYFDLILGYFEMTGIDPKYNQLPPQVSIVKALKEECNIIYKRIEDCIKISRAIEDQKINPILHAVENLSLGKVNSSVQEEIGPTEEEVFQLVKYNEELEKQVGTLQNDVISLKNRIKANQQVDKIQEVIDDLNELLSEKMLSKDKDGNLLVSLEYKDQLIKKIRTYCNV